MLHPVFTDYLELLQWILYNTIIPLMPIPLVRLGAWIIGANQKFLSILSNGQLCFYCTAISASAIRDIVTKSPEDNILKGIFVGGIVFCMILSTFAYGVAAIINQIDEDKLNISNRLAWTSILAAVTTTILVAWSRNFLRLL